jgi:hypothetical protein
MAAHRAKARPSVHRRDADGIPQLALGVRSSIVHGGAILNTTTADEVERLRAAEAEAEQRRGEAIKRGDLFAARNAARDWLKASDALSEYVAAHYRPLS